MRSHAKQAKAPSTASTTRRARSLGAAALVPFVLVLALACALCPTSAGAAGFPEHAPLPELAHTGFTVPCGVATDSQGNYYVADFSAKTITVFSPTGTQLTQFSTTAGPCKLDVDSSGRIYATNNLRNQVIRYKPEGATYVLDQSLNGNGTLVAGGVFSLSGVAVDPTTQDVYVSSKSGNEVQEFAKPAGSYTLRVENPESHTTVETGSLEASSTNEQIETALKAALCSGEECLTVAEVTTPTARWKVTFNGTATTPVTAKVDIAPIEIVAGGCTPGTDCTKAFQMFNGAAVNHITAFQSNGTPISNTIGSTVPGAEYIGVDVFGKNGNIYATDKPHNKAIVFNHAGNMVLAEFNGSDSPTGAFNFGNNASLPDIAVDQANGHAYVSDIWAHHVVDEFDGAGNFVSQLAHTPAFEEASGNGVAVDNGASSPGKGRIYLTALTEAGAVRGVFAFGPLIYGLPLKVTKTGLGSGTVTSSPAGIECGTSCEAEFERDSTVTLSAQASPGSVFTGWSGCGAVISGECEVTMDAVREVSANFDSKPVISGEATSQVTDSSARLEALVNPKGKATTYRFEYLTEAAYQANGESFSGLQPASKAPASPVAAGSGTANVSAALKVSGLKAATAYRFRLVATSSVGATEGPAQGFATYLAPDVFPGCPNDAFRSGVGAKLPDCRAYEQASPVDKDGGSVQGMGYRTRASLDGSAITFESAAGVPGGVGAQEFPAYVAKRGGGTWSTQGLLPDPSAGSMATVLGATPDLLTAFDSAGIPGGGIGLYARSTEGAPLTELAPRTLPEPIYHYIGAAEGGSTVLFEARPSDASNTTQQLTDDAAPGKPNVYAWDRETGELRLAGVLPDGQAPTQGSVVGEAGGQSYNEDMHAVTEDGSVFFSDYTDGQLYLRLNPGQPETTAKDSEGNCVPDPVLACTIHVSASQKDNGGGPDGHDAAGPQAAVFRAAATDGSRAIFTSSEKLTNDANTGLEPQPAALARANVADGSGKQLGFLPLFAKEIAVDETGGYVYWTDPAHNRIGRAKLDKSEVDDAFITGLSAPQGIAVIDEPGKEYIFWTDRGELDAEGKAKAGQGTIGRAKLDKSEVNQSCLTGLTNPRSIAVRPDFIYWTIPTGVQDQGQVGRADLACNQGSVNSQLLTANLLASGDIAVDASHIYYSASAVVLGGGGVGFIRRLNLDGTDAGTGSGNGDSIVQVPGATSPPGLALDGSHLYWTDPNGSKIGRSDLEGTDGSEEPSFIAEANKPSDLALDAGHVYWAANQNVSANPGNDLYSFDPESGVLKDLAPDTADTNGVQVLGVLGASEDASYVYFAANGVPDGLTGSPNANGEVAAPGNCHGAVSESGSGSCNLYLAHGGEVSFISRLDAAWVGSEHESGDNANWDSAQEFTFSQGKAARVSAEGRTLLFRSRRQLTGYENEGPICQQSSDGGIFHQVPGPCLELYLYQVGEPGLLCVSCNPTGAPPALPARLGSLNSPGLAAPTPAALVPRNLSADGNRVFFESADPLVAADTNGYDGCPRWGSGKQKQFSLACGDVYEWEAEDSGTCRSAAANGGCLYLLSSGKGTEPSFFADASENGDDVFIFTHDRLVGQDEDELLDIYDVRKEGGLPFQHQVAPVPCEGEACKGSAGAPPASSSAASASFQGSGNQAEQSCPKGKRKVRRNGKARCLKPKRHKRARHRATKTNRRAGR